MLLQFFQHIYFFILWLCSSIRSYISGKLEKKSVQMEPEAKKQKIEDISNVQTVQTEDIPNVQTLQTQDISNVQTVQTEDVSNVQTVSLIWLDESNESSEENIAAQDQLRTFDSNLKIFIDDNKCEEYI